MIIYVKAQGGFVIVNHYDSNATAVHSYNDLYTWGVDGFEIVNDGIAYPPENTTEIRDFCLANGLACIAASDVHTNQELHTVTKMNVTDMNNLTEIFETLKLNNHETVMIDLYPDKVNLPYIEHVSQPFEDALNYFLNLDILPSLQRLG